MRVCSRESIDGVRLLLCEATILLPRTSLDTTVSCGCERLQVVSLGIDADTANYAPIWDQYWSIATYHVGQYLSIIGSGIRANSLTSLTIWPLVARLQLCMRNS